MCKDVGVNVNLLNQYRFVSCDLRLRRALNGDMILNRQCSKWYWEIEAVTESSKRSEGRSRVGKTDSYRLEKRAETRE